jgi:C4-dicarboxylate-binding protein DctP
MLTLVSIMTAFSLFIAGCGGGTQEGGTPAEGGKKEGTAEEQIVIKFSHVVAPKSPKGQAADLFAKLAAEKTDGRVKVEVYPSSQLYGDKDELENLQYNNVQFIAPSVTKLVGLDGAFQIADMPFMFQTNDAVYKFWDGEGGTILSDKLGNFGISSVAMWPNGFKQFTNSKKELVTPADFSGLKFRTQAGKVLEAQFSALNAGAHPLPFSEVYSALQQGTVDGQENTFNNIDTQKYEEVQKYLTVTNHGRIDYLVLTNKEFWDGLPEDIRTALSEAMTEATVEARNLADSLNADSEKALRASGKMQVKDLTPDEVKAFQDAMQPVYDEFGGVIGDEILNIARKSNE